MDLLILDSNGCVSKSIASSARASSYVSLPTNGFKQQSRRQVSQIRAVSPGSCRSSETTRRRAESARIGRHKPRRRRFKRLGSRDRAVADRDPPFRRRVGRDAVVSADPLNPAKYIQGTPVDAKTGFTGVIYHEMTHTWQWNGNGQAPGGLIEGIADFVRLKAGYPAKGWAKPGQGDKWDHGYDVTALFLDYCNSLRYGFVGELNKKMRESYDDSFFVDLLGKTVDQLWSDYKAKYNNQA